MFKLKPGNVFQKLNTMDKKQAYTWGAIVVVCFIALITLASFLDDADLVPAGMIWPKCLLLTTKRKNIYSRPNIQI